MRKTSKKSILLSILLLTLMTTTTTSFTINWHTLYLHEQIARLSPKNQIGGFLIVDLQKSLTAPAFNLDAPIIYKPSHCWDLLILPNNKRAALHNQLKNAITRYNNTLAINERKEALEVVKKIAAIIQSPYTNILQELRTSIVKNKKPLKPKISNATIITIAVTSTAVIIGSIFFFYQKAKNVKIHQPLPLPSLTEQAKQQALNKKREINQNRAKNPPINASINDQNRATVINTISKDIAINHDHGNRTPALFDLYLIAPSYNNQPILMKPGTPIPINREKDQKITIFYQFEWREKIPTVFKPFMKKLGGQFPDNEGKLRICSGQQEVVYLLENSADHIQISFSSWSSDYNNGGECIKTIPPLKKLSSQGAMTYSNPLLSSLGLI